MTAFLIPTVVSLPVTSTPRPPGCQTRRRRRGTRSHGEQTRAGPGPRRQGPATAPQISPETIRDKYSYASSLTEEENKKSKENGRRKFF